MHARDTPKSYVFNTLVQHKLREDFTVPDFIHKVTPAAAPGSVGEDSTTKPGVFEFAFTPANGGRYKVFVDFIMMRSGSRVLLKDSFDVEGERVQPAWTGALQARSGKYSFTLRMADPQIRSGQTQAVEIQIVDTANGQPVQLQPIMGAYAHLVAFDAARRGFAHFHPLSADEELWDPSLDGLQFSFSLGDPGQYRLWAQVRIDDREQFVPFDLKVI